MKPGYKRMLSAMAAAGSVGEPKEWSVYIVKCSDETLYTGVAKDASARIAKHNAGRGAAYTRSRRPVQMIYALDGFTRSEALIEEARIKTLPREEKSRMAERAGEFDRDAGKQIKYRKTAPRRKRQCLSSKPSS